MKTKILDRNIHCAKYVDKRAMEQEEEQPMDVDGERDPTQLLAQVPSFPSPYALIPSSPSILVLQLQQHTHTALDWSVTKQHAGWERNGGEGNSIDFSSSGRWTADQGARLLQREGWEQAVVPPLMLSSIFSPHFDCSSSITSFYINVLATFTSTYWCTLHPAIVGQATPVHLSSNLLCTQ